MADEPMNGGAFVHNNTTPPTSKHVMRLFSLKGKTAIVSGAGAGIGLAVVQGFAEAGANVAIWYNSNKSAIDRAKEIEQEYGVNCKAYQVNILDPASIASTLTQTLTDLNGRLDIFVANSGIPWTQGSAIDGDPAHFRAVVGTDFDGTFYCAQAVGAVFRRQKSSGTDLHGTKLANPAFNYGSFIATASMSGHIANIPQAQAPYNAAKAAVIHLCKCLAVEWVRFARVNTVSPGYIATEITNFVPDETKDIWRDKIPMGREGEPHEMKGVYLFLASDASTYMTGADLLIDGGYAAP